MIQKVELVSVPSIKVIGLKEKSSIENMIDNMEKILTFVGSNEKIEEFGSPMFIYHIQDEFESEDPESLAILVEICMPVEGDNIKCPDEFKIYTLEGGDMISAIYQGPYENIWEEKEKLHAFLEEKGFEIVGPERDVFIGNLEEDEENDNDENEKKEEIEHTEILIPVKKVEKEEE